MWKVLALTFVLIASIIQSTVFVICDNFSNDRLVFAHVIFRHGNRTPLATYPSDPWKDKSHWSHGWGQLTNVGKRTQFHLGQWLRNRYNDLISETYSEDEIYVQATEVDRVLMSALSNLAGLYPPRDKDLWLSNIHWQPIPVHQVSKPMDHIIAGTRNCPKFHHLLQKYMQSDVYRTYYKSIEPILNYTSLHSQKQIDSVESIYDLYSCLDVEYENGLKLPPWTSSVYPEPLRSISGEMFRLHTNTTEMARLKAGPMIKDILTRFQKKADKTLIPNRSLWIYSGHDTSVVNLLNGLGLFTPHNPPFAACVLVELRKPSSDSPYVSVYYKDSSEDPEALNISNCGPRCPLEKMFELYQDIIPEDWERECET
ncbi:testicular acid phosphatase homolog [Aedes aegypti]|uniref:acid phosphatase n=1 Tax=Aedes aegypti TaxID=7159 RepID=A0A1S4F682_AEDAE|nr:testicular acid phosphatase homolog [Aedes aegypti]